MSKDGMFDGMVEEGAGDAQPVDEANVGNPLAVYSDSPQFDAEDVFIPRLRLAQGLSTEVQDGSARPGQWLVAGFGPEEEVSVVPLLFTRQRELRDMDDEVRNVMCFSSDSVTGAGEPGGTCKECPLSKWSEGTGGRKKDPPKCFFSYNYIVYSEAHGNLLTTRFQRMAISAGKMLNTVIAHHGLGNVVVKFSSDQRKGPRGNFFVPRVVVDSDPPEGLLEDARASVQGSMYSS